MSKTSNKESNNTGANKILANSPYHSQKRLSMVAENYLLSIYYLQENNENKISLTELAEYLKNAPVSENLGSSLPSVSAMIKRLIKEGLLTQNPKDLELSSAGKQSAEFIVRRHRLAERLVVDILGLDLEHAYEEAHLLEHAISPKVEKRLIELLDHPTTGAFGQKIPGSNHQDSIPSLPLIDTEPNNEYIILSIPPEDQELLTYLVYNRIVPGTNVKVLEVSKARGVISIHCNNQDITFSLLVANKIIVTAK
tara:strand:- start:200 stop:958 length:759 start_codon:yes stop_codon:yes gene_type:complete